MKYYVYAYRTPIDIEIESKSYKIPAGEIFYIGKGKGKRKTDHLTEKFEKVSNYLKYGIIQKIYKNNMNPIIEIIEESDNEQFIFEREIHYIKKYGKLINNTGYLTNLTDGGTGSSGFKHSEETRKKLGKMRKGKIPYNKGIKRPGIGGRPKGIVWSEETRKKIMKVRCSEGYYDFCKNEERRRKISESKKGHAGSALGKSWYNNGIIETYKDTCPEGFFKGRLKKESNGKKGLYWYTNGVETRQFKENCQPEGWKRGRTIRK